MKRLPLEVLSHMKLEEQKSNLHVELVTKFSCLNCPYHLDHYTPIIIHGYSYVHHNELFQITTEYLDSPNLNDQNRTLYTFKYFQA